MTITVQMIQTRQGAGGATLTAGQEYDLSNELAIELVGLGFAVDVYGVIGDASDSLPSPALKLSATQVSKLNAAGWPVPKGTLLRDPTTLLIYGQSDGAGGYVAIGGGTFVGAYTWAARPLASLTVGDTFRASDIGRAPGTVFVWDGSAWVGWWPYRWDSGRVTGTTGAAEQMPAGLSLALPAGLLLAYKAVELELIPRRDVATDAVNLSVRIGTSGTLTSNTQLLLQNNILQSTDTQRYSTRWEWRIESATSLRLTGAGANTGIEGGSGGGTVADPAAVTISDASANALNLSVGCTMAGASTTPTFTAIWTFKP